MIAAGQARRQDEAPRERGEADVEIPGEAPKRKFTVGRLVILLALAALAVWIGVRVRAATRAQAAIAEEGVKAAKAAENSGPTKVSVVTPMPRTWTPEVPLEGTLAPSREADLAFKVPGRLAAIKVKTGSYVKQGAALAYLEQTEVEAQVKAVQAQVRAAEAQLALADDGEKRTSALVQTGAQAPVMGIQVSKQRDLAAAQADAARAQLALAQATLANHVLSAPFSGYVTRVPSGPGGVVNPGVPLFHLQDVATLKLVGTVGDGDAPLVRVGTKVRVQLEGRTREGTIAAVQPSVDPVTRRLPVEATLPNDPDQPILAGSFVRAVVMGDKPIQVLALPSSVVRPGSQSEVMVVVMGRMSARKVGYATSGAEVLVRSGLQPDEVVVSAPSAESRDGDPVVAQ
jgi:membrane fusion protein (multidrug efflux system)